MFLLRLAGRRTCNPETKFTFQYVSIKTRFSRRFWPVLIHLHSNMFLLRHAWVLLQKLAEERFTFQYVSIKTNGNDKPIHTAYKFTFQYVSIKTVIGKDLYDMTVIIYIPICFY